MGSINEELISDSDDDSDPIIKKVVANPLSSGENSITSVEAQTRNRTLNFKHIVFFERQWSDGLKKLRHF